MTSTGRQPADHRRAADCVTDAGLFGFSTLVGGFAMAGLWRGHSLPLDAVDLAVGALACLGLWFRRSAAIALAVVAASAFSPLALGAGLVATGSIAARARGRLLAVLAVMLLAGSFLFLAVNPAAGEFVPVRQSVPAVAFPLLALGWGLYLRSRRDLVASLRERARELQAGRQRDAELARQAERRRIAGEMHDVLAHRLSLLSVHAGALEFNPGAPAAEIAGAAAVIRESAAAALTDLRQVITMLRESDDAVAEPVPGLARLPDLIEESRVAGMTVTASLDLPAPGTVPPLAGGAVYRVVQEGLTNARKHAHGAPATVTVAGSGHDGLRAEVISGPPPVVRLQGRPLPGAGTGLVGLSERLALAGGTLEHGTSAAGEFILRATIPASGKTA